MKFIRAVTVKNHTDQPQVVKICRGEMPILVFAVGPAHDAAYGLVEETEEGVVWRATEFSETRRATVNLRNPGRPWVPFGFM